MASRPDPDVSEQLADRLQAALPLVQRIFVTCRQSSLDAQLALDSLERAVGLLKSFARLERDRRQARGKEEA